MVQWELDSFYLKFKNLLRSEKDATLTLKAEAGRAFVTLSLDIGQVHSEHGQLQPHGPRNGPARLRRCEKRAAARADAENASAEVIEAKDVELAEKAEEVLAGTIGSAAGEAAGLNLASKANEFDEKPAEKAETLEDLKDEVCPDDIYRFPNDSNVLSVGTQTLECGVANSHPSKSTLDFYTLTYDDYDEYDDPD